MHKIIRIPVVAVILLIMVSLWQGVFSHALSETKTDSTEKIPHIEVKHPLKKDLLRALTLPGDIVPDQEAILYARSSGYLDRLFVDRGSWVKEGEVLAQINAPELVKELEVKKAEFALADPMLRKAEAEWVWKKAQYERARELIKKSPNLISQDQVDELKGKYKMALAELKVVKARYPVLKAMMEKTETLVNFSTIQAPFGGVVMDRWVDEGDFIQSGSTKIVHLMKMNQVRVRIHISEPDVPFVQVGSHVTMTIDEFPGQEWKNLVSRFSWALNRNTKTMMAEIDVKNDPVQIRPGMYARVTLELEKHLQVLTIPASTLVVEGDKMFVFVVKEGVAKKIPIKTGFDNGIEIEASEGLTDQDDVVISGRNLISDGDAVRITRRGQE